MLNRRKLLQTGLLGFSSLSLSQVMGLRALAAEQEPAERTAVILVWLRGGASHLETFDPKPEDTTEFRGPYSAINTNVPGIRIGELLPNLAKIADKYAILRSIAHTGGGHPAGSLQVLGGDPDAADKPKPVLPDWMSVVSYLRRDPKRSIPNYVAINPVDNYDNFVIAGSTYLGPAYEPFTVVGDPSSPRFEVPNISLKSEQGAGLSRRLQLKSSLDSLRREIDATGTIDAVDRYESQALNLLTSPEARKAFDLSNESDRLRDRYGRNAWGQQCGGPWLRPRGSFGGRRTGPSPPAPLPGVPGRGEHRHVAWAPSRPASSSTTTSTPAPGSTTKSAATCLARFPVARKKKRAKSSRKTTTSPPNSA